MNAELWVELAGKVIIASCGLIIGVRLLWEARRARSRVMIHWSVMFLAASGYLAGALIVLNWGDPVVLTRLHYVSALIASFPGALSATILMLPLPDQWGEPLSLYLPAALLAGLLIPVLTGRIVLGTPRQEGVYSGSTTGLCVAVMVVAGMVSVAILLFLAARLRNKQYLALAVAFLLITMGGRWVGTGLLNLALGELTVVAGYLLFYGIFVRLMSRG